MKSKKFKIIFVCILIFGAIFFDTHYAVINKEIYKNNTKKIRPYLGITSIREINKCTEIETMFLSDARKNSVSKLKNFPNLNHLMIMSSDISSADCEKISTFDSLNILSTFETDIDFKGFNNNIVSHIILDYSKTENLNVLSECKSLKSITINNILYDNYIVFQDNQYVMKDSSVFANFDYVEELRLFVNKIEDISGIIEMDSLKTLVVDKGTVSEDDRKLLEDKGISVIEND